MHIDYRNWVVAGIVAIAIVTAVARVFGGSSGGAGVPPAYTDYVADLVRTSNGWQMAVGEIITNYELGITNVGSRPVCMILIPSGAVDTNLPDGGQAMAASLAMQRLADGRRCEYIQLRELPNGPKR